MEKLSNQLQEMIHDFFMEYNCSSLPAAMNELLQFYLFKKSAIGLPLIISENMEQINKLAELLQRASQEIKPKKYY